MNPTGPLVSTQTHDTRLQLKSRLIMGPLDTGSLHGTDTHGRKTATMKNLAPVEIWFVTGSQHLYGAVALKQVAAKSRQIVTALNAADLPTKLVCKPVLTTPDEIRQLCLEANATAKCAGLVLWMHTFSPSKMWIGGLTALQKPFLDLQGGKFCRFGDNMRQVAVTEGDKVSAEIKLGFSVNGYGVGHLVKAVADVTDRAVDQLCKEYEQCYAVAPKLRKGGGRHASLREGARIELGMRAFLEVGNFKGFTTTFEDLLSLKQLPGLAVQRLMADGYGFGAEGDWKTCALLRAMKVMAEGLPGGTSFMEDYTYHLNPAGHLVLGSHMLEVCESIAAGTPTLEIHPLGIGGKEDPVRLVFDAPAGPALNASLLDLGNRFRLLVGEVDVVVPPQPLPKLPVARAVWQCRPDFKTACAAWIYAGGAHHTGFSYAVTTEHLEDFAAIAGIELAVIDAKTEIREFKQQLRNNEIYYHLAPGLGNL